MALAAVKFMFAPLYGKGVGLSFLETYLSLIAGGVLASFIFFKLTNKLLARAKQKRFNRRQQALSMEFEYFEPKKFTRTNKLVVKMRRRFGFFFCSFFFPFFLSVPIGTIIATKFFGTKPLFYLVVVLGLVVNGLIATSLVYLL
jgi:ABC-type antimicrobial peptide transport system permease subunit